MVKFRALAGLFGWATFRDRFSGILNVKELECKHGKYKTIVNDIINIIVSIKSKSA